MSVKQSILAAAWDEFERHSYSGARMQRIADRAGVPKANVHYHFGSKLALYNRVLSDIVELWDQAFEGLDSSADPAAVLTGFVRRKVEFTRLYPQATRIFTSEILHNAPYLDPALNEWMNTWTRERAEVIAQWVKSGRIRPVDPYHLIFMIWAGTQHYAVAEFQILSVLGQPALGAEDFDRLGDSLVDMVLLTCGLQARDDLGYPELEHA